MTKEEKHSTFQKCLDASLERLNKLRADWTVAFEAKLSSKEEHEENNQKMVELNEKIEFEQDLYDVIRSALHNLTSKPSTFLLGFKDD